ncbi:hypothetical protein BGZ60DRAFT_418991 [Tricladium varicosporioides]|nr:hypothetical protein BGZ60DRAFT_418991 [Hymenoscyphus varicosporioides]
MITSQLSSHTRSLRCKAVACFCYHHKAHRCYDSSRRLFPLMFQPPMQIQRVFVVASQPARCLWVVGLKPPGEKHRVCAGSRGGVVGGEMQQQILQEKPRIA